MNRDLLTRAREAFDAGRRRGLSRDARLAAVIAVVQEDRTRATLAILDGLMRDSWSDGYAAALYDVRANVKHQFGGTHD